MMTKEAAMEAMVRRVVARELTMTAERPALAAELAEVAEVSEIDLAFRLWQAAASAAEGTALKTTQTMSAVMEGELCALMELA